MTVFSSQLESRKKKSIKTLVVFGQIMFTLRLAYFKKKLNRFYMKYQNTLRVSLIIILFNIIIYERALECSNYETQNTCPKYRSFKFIETIVRNITRANKPV